MKKTGQLIGLASLLAITLPAWGDEALYYYDCGGNAAAALPCASDGC